jgi:glutamate-1-semialdehyde 2,1-aminomutase
MSKVTITRFEQRFRTQTPRSAALFREAQTLLPGGLTRSTLQVEPYPVALASGSGATVTDVDGNTYIDLVNNYTALVHGNAHPAITAAVTDRFTQGASLASPHATQIRLAELIATRLPSVELVRFANPGSEAATLAVRIARRATGRRNLVVFEGGYHGTSIPFADPDDEVVTVPFNDLRAVAEAIGAGIAAVFAEPFLGAGGVVPADSGFLASVQELCREAGALFVLDEVQSLRNGAGGAQAAEGLLPDLTLMGKVIGGGLPIGAVGGRRDLLGLTDATRTQALSHSGTMNGHLAAMVAGAVSLELLTESTITQLVTRASGLAVTTLSRPAACASTGPSATCSAARPCRRPATVALSPRSTSPSTGSTGNRSSAGSPTSATWLPNCPRGAPNRISGPHRATCSALATGSARPRSGGC